MVLGNYMSNDKRCHMVKHGKVNHFLRVAAVVFLSHQGYKPTNSSTMGPIVQHHLESTFWSTWMPRKLKRTSKYLHVSFIKLVIECHLWTRIPLLLSVSMIDYDIHMLSP